MALIVDTVKALAP